MLQKSFSARYYVIPSIVFEDPRLEKSEIVFFALLSYLSDKGYCTATDACLSKLSDATERKVKNWINHLERFGHIESNLRRIDNEWERQILINNYDSKPSIRLIK